MGASRPLAIPESFPRTLAEHDADAPLRDWATRWGFLDPLESGITTDKEVVEQIEKKAAAGEKKK